MRNSTKMRSKTRLCTKGQCCAQENRFHNGTMHPNRTQNGCTKMAQNKTSKTGYRAPKWLQNGAPCTPMLSKPMHHPLKHGPKRGAWKKWNSYLLSRPAGASKLGIGTYQRIKFVQQLASRKVATGFWFAWLRNSVKRSTMHPDRHQDGLQNDVPSTQMRSKTVRHAPKNGIQNAAQCTEMGSKTRHHTPKWASKRNGNLCPSQPPHPMLNF